MAVILVEGFDHLSASLLTTKGWNPVTSLVAGRYTAPAGAATSQAASCAGVGVNQVQTIKTLPSTYATLIVGVAINFAGGAGVNVNNAGPVTFMDSVSNPIGSVSVNPSGRLQVANGSGSIIATGTTILNVLTWYYIEFKLFVNGASGTCEVHLDGVSEIGSTVGNFGSTNVGRLFLGQTVGGVLNLVNFDDVYVADTTGSPPQNTFLGAARVITPLPNGIGNYSQWTPNGTTPNYACVDEVPPDGDTTFVSSNTVGQLDSYQVSDVPLGATIFAVQTNLYSRKDDANTRQIAGLIRQAGVDYVGNTFTEAASYVDHTQIYNQDPTGAAWTVATFNADEFGEKEIA